MKLLVTGDVNVKEMAVRSYSGYIAYICKETPFDKHR